MSALEREYLLGSDPSELARLDAQAATIAPATELFLRAAGVAEGMRVLDLGTGLGHVAMLARALVGPRGEVVGIDRAATPLEIAARRARAAGATNVRFVEGDVTSWRDADRFDAVVGRLVLFHVQDPVAVLRHNITALRPGGLVLAIDFDLGGVRAEPPAPLASRAVGWVIEALRRGGGDPMIGTQLGRMLAAAGLREVTTFGVQPYLPPGSPTGARLVAGIVRSLAPMIIAHDVATADELDIDSLEARIASEVREANATFLPPTVAGAWGRGAPT